MFAGASLTDSLAALGPVPHPAPSMVVMAEPMIVADKDPSGATTMSRPVPVPESSVSAETVEVLNAVLAPREWREGSTAWRQFALHIPASRQVTAAVQRKLDAELVDRQARPSGLCSIREELFSQTFDEIIREVCLHCPERGLLLVRIRDELRMSVAAYRTLYEASAAYGTRTLERATRGMDDLDRRVKELTLARDRSLARLHEATALLEAQQRDIASKAATEDKRRQDELEFLVFQNQQLEDFIKSAALKRGRMTDASDVLEGKRRGDGGGSDAGSVDSGSGSGSDSDSGSDSGSEH